MMKIYSEGAGGSEMPVPPEGMAPGMDADQPSSDQPSSDQPTIDGVD